MMISNSMTSIALRLHPGQDVLVELESLVKKHEIEAACVLACVGSLTTACLRFANRPEPRELHGHFEIVSLSGLLSRHGSHFHISLSDGQGKTYGAHLLPGSAVYTTAEIVLGVFSDLRFLRTFDPATGFPELEVQAVTQKGMA